MFKQSNRSGGNVSNEGLKEDFKLGAPSWRYNPLWNGFVKMRSDHAIWLEQVTVFFILLCPRDIQLIGRNYSVI